MAISWAVQITLLDGNTRHVSIAATRTDSVDPANPKTYTVGPCHIDTAAQRAVALDALWSQHVAAAALAAKVVAFGPTIAALETAAQTNLQGREG
jgi:hypothetical protein